MLGVVTITLWGLNVLFWGTLLVLAIPLRVIPHSRAVVTAMMQAIVQRWGRAHVLITDIMLGVTWEVRGLETLSPELNYLIVANHRSWLDVPIIVSVLTGRTSFIRFFAKRELRWVPLVGAALWALEMPMVRRVPKTLVERNPALREHDLATTRRACARFGLHRPESLLSFAEGTRLTRRKYEAQSPPYRNLLKPKLGGISLVLAAVGERLQSLVDVTLIYPVDGPIVWRMANGEVSRVIIDVVERAVPVELVTPRLLEDEDLRVRFRNWIDAIWRDKDAKLTAGSGILSRDEAPSTGRGHRASAVELQRMIAE